MHILIAIAVGLSVIMSGCSKEEKDEANGNPIGAPAIKPPVERNTPAGFSAGLGLTQETTPPERLINAIQTYLKPEAGDASGALERLTAIDTRMSELDMRTQTSPQRICLLETAKSFTLGASLPGSDSFSLSFQCQENLDNGTGGPETSQLAFGLTDTHFFLMERAGAFNNAVLAKSTMDGKVTEFWQLGTGQSNSYIHLRAEDGVGMEFTSSGTGTYQLDCGIHMKSNSSFVYVEGYDSVGTCGTELITVCLTAATMESTALTDCTTAGLNAFTLDTLSVAKATTVDPAAQTIIKKPISGFIDFTKGVEETPPN